MCISCINTLLKVVSHYDLSGLSMSVMGFPKKRRIDGLVSVLSIFSGNLFLTLQSS